MKYMLDTNTVIYAMKANPAEVLKKFREYTPGDLCISAITMAELEFGVWNSSDPGKNRLALLVFLSEIPILPFDVNAAGEYGAIRSALKQKGRIIGANDMLIAAHAKSLNLTLITNNTREFSRVEGLKTGNWINQ
ncbi:MAG: type II toxin-antitoxin system VapC family toxin [Erysipelotrichaceae bacterium]|nr:type II toxin-antitoxin system VapC family toxin [Erysipelotrichaceae bacterium]